MEKQGSLAIIILSLILAMAVGLGGCVTGNPSAATAQTRTPTPPSVAESKSGRFFTIVNGILPLIFPQKVPLRVPVKGLLTGKATEVVFLLHSASLAQPHYLERICYERLAGLILKYQLRHLRQANCRPCRFVVIDSDDADETVPVAGPLALREPTVPRSAGKVPLFTAPSTPPEDVGEVWP